jgi:hypothetical protein
MEKSEIKQLVKECINKDPPLKNYLEINHIYGKYISVVTKYVVRYFCKDYKYTIIGKINFIISRSYPLDGYGFSKYNVSRQIIQDIFNNQ